MQMLIWLSSPWLSAAMMILKMSSLAAERESQSNETSAFRPDGGAELLDRKDGIYRGRCSNMQSGEKTSRFERVAYPVVRSARVRGNRRILTNNNGQDEKNQRM